MHSAQQINAESPWSRAWCAISLIAWMMATIKLPRQMEPKEYVTDLKKESHTALEQNEDAPDGWNHHSATVPQTLGGD